MDEIKVGEYVRTKDGIIDKIIHYDNDTKLLRCENNNFIDPFDNIAIPISEIVKHSFNIIDLIEIGDVVNGERILDITGDYIHTNETDHNKFYLEKHIKRILTKEQYERNCYVLEGR